MNDDMLGFQLPQWGSNASSNLSFGIPMSIPSWGTDSSTLGTTDLTTANMPGVLGGYTPLEFGMNIPTAQLGLQGLGTLGNLWGSFQSNKLAKDAFKFQKGMAEKNYANQIKSYNTALADRATTRGFVQGDNAIDTQRYIAANKL